MITVFNISPVENEVFMQMKDGEEVISEAYAKTEGDTAELVFIREYKPNLAFDMGKSILNSLDLKGVKKVICKSKDLEQVLERLKFKPVENSSHYAYSLMLEGYFKSNC
ncbi:MAG: hypothetical protein PHF89_01115 [Eubacteriales bacterium]|jgi:hypothetical protein|nr:hypothetical protein [Eubacteriales bacterium]